MKIRKLTIKNFKKFKDKFEFEFSDQNFFVGENNTGKTSVIDAINYLLNGPEKDKKYKNLNSGSNDFVTVEAEIYGEFIVVDSKYKDYILEDLDGVSFMKIKRSDEVKKIKQSGKDIILDESKILCWNDTTGQFENPSGRDTTFNVIDIVCVYANDHVDDVVSFDTTKILGKLIKSSVGDFFNTEEYEKFKQHHNDIFNIGPDSLKSRLNDLSKDISEILKEQWGELEINFKFDLVDNSNHLKKGSLLIKENEIEHELENKGSGLQRSVMLSMIQALSKVYKSDKGSNIILCIDEPELNLHPKAQEKLSAALSKLSENIQIIVSTHSPYMLKSFKKGSDNVYVFKNGKNADPKKLEKVSVLPFGPTLSEIQYFAYNLTPNDFHNELYGYLESENKISIFSNSKKWLNKRDLVKLAKNKGFDVSDLSDMDMDSVKKDVSLQTYIRHSIHHPENDYNIKFTEDEINESIQEMISTI